MRVQVRPFRLPGAGHIVSPWVAEGDVFNQEHRHTSLIATLRDRWNLGDAFSGRDAAARTFSHAFTLDQPRHPGSWPVPTPRPVPTLTVDATALGQVLSQLGKTFLDGLRQHATESNVKLEGLPSDPNVDIPPAQIITVIRSALALYFPLLAPP